MTTKRAILPATFCRLTHGLRRVISGWAIRATDIFQLRLARYRDRRKLEAMSDHMLKDMGLSRVDAGDESRKHF